MSSHKKYAQKRRMQIELWIKRKDTQLISLVEAQQQIKRIDYYEVFTNVYAVLDPQIVASLDYYPILNVAHIREVSIEKKQWLIEYWQDKYEIDVSESEESYFAPWNSEIGLIFVNCDYQGDSYESIYDYPSCLIATFLLVKEGKDQ